MKENELIFDRTKHVCYSEAVKQVITDCLKKQFSKKEADILWEKIQLKYTEYLQTLPYLGGAKDNHNAPGGTYDCIALFAYYEVLDRKPSIQEIYEMNNAILLPPFRILLGTFAGAGVWQTLENGLNLIHAQVGFQRIIIGVIVVGAVLLDVVVRSGNFKKKKSK